MINNIIQIAFFQVVFLAVYDLFLRKETFFKWNRLYLLATPILTFIIPVLKFDGFKNTVSEDYIVMLPEVVLNPQVVIEQTSFAQEIQNYFFQIFYVGLVIFSILFIYKLFKILKLIADNHISKKENYTLVFLEKEHKAFSFFNYIFIGKSLLKRNELQIVKHELVHSEQYHTLDLLLFELLKIVMWFNPLIYIYQKRITLLHEYISDAEVVKETDKKSYFNKLLKETFDIENISFVNQFYKHSLIKKRVIMIAKEKSRSVKQLKYLMLIPLMVSMLLYVSCTDKTVDENSVEEIIEVVETNDYEKKSKVEEGELIEVVEETEDVPFYIIEEVPVYPGCTGDREELKKCLNLSIQKHVFQNFNSKLPKALGLKGDQKMYAKFIITYKGEIKITEINAPHEKLEAEVRRVVNLIPKMNAGKQRGKEVNVSYVLPISFKVD